MGISNFARPDTTTLTLANGDKLVVFKRLAHGHQRQAYRHMYTRGPDGTLEVDTLQTGLALVLAYLVDWKLSDRHAPDSEAVRNFIPILGMSMDDLASVLDNLPSEDFIEIKNAIETHEAAMQAERAAAKNGSGGEQASSATSLSPSGPV